MGTIVVIEATRLYVALSAGASLPSGISLLHIGYTNTRCSPLTAELFIDTISPDTVDSANLNVTGILVSCMYTLYPLYMEVLKSHWTITVTSSADEVQLKPDKFCAEAKNIDQLKLADMQSHPSKQKNSPSYFIQTLSAEN